MMIITPVTKSDLPELQGIVSICIELMKEVPDEEKENIENLILKNIESNLELEGNVYIKAMYNNAIIGFILIKRYEKLSELFVHPKYRNKNTGTALLKKALEESKAKSAGDNVWVNAAISAVSFYKKNGFVDFETNDQMFTFVKRLKYYF